MVDRSLIQLPIITEKSTMLAAQNKYVFLVKPQATKNEVKKAIFALYKVAPIAVDIVNLPAKRKGTGRVSGTMSPRKKAIVTLKPGDTITIA
jgi:large subunit ribosomal protein L23